MKRQSLPLSGIRKSVVTLKMYVPLSSFTAGNVVEQLSHLLCFEIHYYVCLTFQRLFLAKC